MSDSLGDDEPPVSMDLDAVSSANWRAVHHATLTFVIRNEQILLIRKKRGLGAGKINGPGGKLDPGETPLQAAIRETEEELLTRLRSALTEATGAATTLGYGPRFLHSTGQLHKGGANNGVFLQLIDDGAAHLHVPESDFTFRQLIRAQARGDLGALAQRERRTLRVRVGDPDGVGLRRLIQLIEENGEESS